MNNYFGASGVDTVGGTESQGPGHTLNNAGTSDSKVLINLKLNKRYLPGEFIAILTYFKEDLTIKIHPRYEFAYSSAALISQSVYVRSDRGPPTEC